MGQLEHPNLVTATDARSVESWQLVVMQWIDGVDLHRLVRAHGPLPVAVACEVARQAALGLQYAHQHGLIHRDIKPSNLMLTRSGTIKVIDMGLALTREDTAAQLTHTGFVLGTMAYCAPEQFRDASKVDIRADIYSLGCTLYHLLTGKAPYWERKTFPELVQAHLNEPFPKLAEARADAPAGLEAVLAHMIAKDPADRFATPAEVAEALESFARGADLKKIVPAKTQEGPPPRVATGKTPAPARRQTTGAGEQPPKARWTRRAALLAAASGVGGAAFLFMNRRKSASAVIQADAALPERSAVSAGVPVSETAPVVVLMDTTAERGIYDEDNKVNGRSNAKEIYELLQREIQEIPPENIHEVPVGLNWARRDLVRAQHPALLIIHRSVFYHPVAAALSFPYPPFESDEESQVFAKRYKILGDDKLREFLYDIGTAVPRTKFLVYSRGTDPNWVRPEYRQAWTKDLEAQYPVLKSRVTPMLITRKNEGTFRNPETREELLKHVREILGLPEKREAGKTK